MEQGSRGLAPLPPVVAGAVLDDFASSLSDTRDLDTLTTSASIEVALLDDTRTQGLGTDPDGPTERWAAGGVRATLRQPGRV